MFCHTLTCFSSPMLCLGRRQWHPTPVLLPGKSHGRRSLEGWSPWSRWGLGTTEWLHFYFSFSCIGEGNGNPLQFSCLENPRDGGAWWAAIYGVAQSGTRLKRLSSSSSILCLMIFSIYMLCWVSWEGGKKGRRGGEEEILTSQWSWKWIYIEGFMFLKS